MRYGLDELKKAINDPYMLLRELNIIFHRALFIRDYNTKGIDIHEQDWDNLIILDACRFDTYRDIALGQLPNGNLEKKESRGSNTKEWIRANFSNRSLHDTVYVTGNSWIWKIGDEINSELHDVVDAKDDFDETLEKQLRKTLEAADKYPNKRLIVHLIPPHHPFIGSTADEVLPDIEEQDGKFMREIRRGNVDVEENEVLKMYEENLERAIPTVKEMIEKLPGKTVVTSDHGELLGERTSPIPIREWGHKRGIYVEELVKVPWHIHDKGDRKIIKEDPPKDTNIDSRTKEEIDRQLKKLGYKA